MNRRRVSVSDPLVGQALQRKALNPLGPRMVLRVLVLVSLAEAFKVSVPAKNLPKPLVYSEFSPTAIALVAVNVSSNEFDLIQGDVDQSSSGGPAILLLPDPRIFRSSVFSRSFSEKL